MFFIGKSTFAWITPENVSVFDTPTFPFQVVFLNSFPSLWYQIQYSTLSESV